MSADPMPGHFGVSITAPKTMERLDVVVIGAGLAGLVAARDLQEAGASVAVFEARDRIGGRAFSSPDALGGRACEYGGAYIGTEHVRIRAELSRYGLGLQSSPASPLAWHTRGLRRVGGLPVPNEELADFERAVRWWHHASTMIERGEPVPGTVAEWFTAARLGPHTTAIVNSFFSEQASSSWDAVSMHGFAVDLADAHGSVASWVQAASMADRIEQGSSRLAFALGNDVSDIRMGCPVRSIRQIGDEVHVCTDSDRVIARAVVLATPLNTWRDLELIAPMTDAARRLVSRGHVGQGYKLCVRVRGQVPGYALTDLPNMQLLLGPDRFDDGSFGVALFGPDPNLVDPCDLDSIRTMLLPLIPDVQVIAAAMHDWAADPWSRGTWLCHGAATTVDEIEAIRGPSGRVFPAGSDVADEFASYLEGAVRSGAAAAADIVNRLEHELKEANA